MSESGFTLIELLTVITLVGVLLGLGAFALRQFWHVRTFHGEQDEIVSQLRNLQERVVAESNPLVYGARFPHGGGRTQWGLIRYDPVGNAGTPSCTQFETIPFDGAVSVTNSPDNDFVDIPSIRAVCRATLGGASNDDDYVFFFARGTATAGGVEIQHGLLEGRRLGVCVNGITGRVEKTEDVATC